MTMTVPLRSTLRPALSLIAAMTVLTGLAIPAAFTGLAALAVPGAAGGSLLRRDGVVVGSRLIGQDFRAAGYFHGRPSATTGPDPADASKTIAIPYDASSSGGSNLAPTSKALVDRVRAAVAAEPGPHDDVPADAVTTSASGLDPDISPADAARQVAGVAAARHLPPGRVEAMVRDATRGRDLGLFGERRVNVLELNLALDAAR